MVSCAILLILLPFVSCRLYDKDRQWYQDYGNPGIKVRLTKKGLEYLREIGMRAMDKEIAKLEGITATANFGAMGSVTLSNLNVTSWEPAKLNVLHMKPPNSIVFGLEDADLGLSSDFLGRQGIFEVPGDMNGLAEGLTMAMTVELTKDYNNDVSARMTSCKAVLQKADFTVNPTGPFAEIVKQYMDVMNGAIRSYLPVTLCQIVSGMVESAAKGVLGKLTKFSFDEIKTDEMSQGQKSVLDRITNGLYMDNTLLTDPIVTEDYLELWLAGELRYNGSELRTPFYASPMPDFHENDKMLYILANEFILNSMIYHAYQQDRLVLKITEADLPVAFDTLFKTTCAGGKDSDEFDDLCIGSWIPSLGETYPDQVVEAIVFPHGLPEFAFSEGDPGRATAYGQGRVYLYAKVNGRKKAVIVSRAYSQAELIPTVKDNKIVSQLRISDLKFKLHRSSIKGIEPENVADLAPVVAQLLHPELEKFEEAFPFPGDDFMELIEPEIVVKEAFARAETDFRIHEKEVEKVVHEMVQSAFSNL